MPPASAPSPVHPAQASPPQAPAPAVAAPSAAKPPVVLQPSKPTHPLIFLGAGVLGAAFIGAIGEGLKNAIRDRIWPKKEA